MFTLAGHSALVSAGNKNGYLYTWFQSNLTLAWQKKLTQGTYVGTTTERNGHLFGVTPPASIGDRKFNSTLFSINPINGQFVWRTGLPGQVSFSYGAPMWVNGVLVVNDGSYLVLVNAVNGKVLYESEPTGGMVPPVSAWGSEVFVGHGDSLTAYVANSSVETGGESSSTLPLLSGHSTDSLLARFRDSPL